MKHPAWWPQCPYPADIFTMTPDQYSAAGAGGQHP